MNIEYLNNYSSNSYLSVNRCNGYIYNLSIPFSEIDPWTKLIEELIQVYTHNFRSSLHSIYLTGSVARGTQIIGHSDLDTFVILLCSPNNISFDWLTDFRERVAIEYSFCRGIDLRCFSYRHLLNHSKYTYLRGFFPLVYSCLFGNDLFSVFPIYSLSELKTYKKEIFSDLSIFDEEFKSCDDPIILSALCKWIFKKIIRSFFEIVMEEEQIYSRDVIVCSNIFCQKYPQYNSLVAEMNEYIFNPICVNEKEKIFDLINDIKIVLLNPPFT